MSRVFSSTYDRRPVVAEGGGAAAAAARAGGLHCRYYATDRRRNRYSTFSIMKWFRRSKHYDDDDDADSAWFRDDLQRIQQAYVEQEADYAAVTPIAPHRRPAATWSRWSGSTTTVYSFAYVEGEQRDDDEQQQQHQGRKNGAYGDDDDDLVEYIDAATLPVARRRFDRDGHHSTSSCGTAFKKSPTTTLNRKGAVGTMTGTRRRNKRVAPLPPPLSPPALTTTAGPSRSSAAVDTAKTMTTIQRRTATTSRKKYRAPPPPTAAESRPQQSHVTGHRGGVPQRRKKGPAPKPPVEQQKQQQQQQQKQQQQQQQQQKQQNQQQQQQQHRTKWETGVDGGQSVSNVRRKISQYERDRLMQRVDKIEKHFLEKSPVGTSASATVGRGEKTTGKLVTSPRGHGFTSVAALYTAMAATNLTELDKRAAEICDRRNRHMGMTATAAVPQRPAAIAADHKNAIVAAVIRKSYPSTVSAAADATRSVSFAQSTTAAATITAAADTTVTRVLGGASGSAADDETRLVRHKRLAFFQPRATTAAGDQRRSSGAVAVKLSLGTQTSGSVVVGAKTSRSTGGGGGGPAPGTVDSKNLPCEDNNCYQQLMAMEMKSDLVLHNGPFECTVCLCTYDNNGVVLRDCLHVFCRPCLKLTIDHSKAEQVVCPYIDEKYSCTGVLQHREIKKILDSDEEYERFLQRSVERARQLLAKDRNGGSFQCRRPDCTGWCLIYDKNEVIEFKCPVCGTVTCVRCGSIHTQGQGCKSTKENSDDDMLNTLENLIDRGDAMICPGCNTVLSKQQGCDWIKCAVCFMEICWATKGPRWGPQGKGDITGGCMCGIPAGRKCHTDCKYCH